MLNDIELLLQPATEEISCEYFSHIGVVGSGDLEILFEKATTDKVKVKITTPIEGFEDVWKLVFERFIQQSNVGPVDVTVNDNNATPAVVIQRLLQFVPNK